MLRAPASRVGGNRLNKRADLLTWVAPDRRFAARKVGYRHRADMYHDGRQMDSERAR